MPEAISRKVTCSLTFYDYLLLLDYAMGLRGLRSYYLLLPTVFFIALFVVPYSFCAFFGKICKYVPWPKPYLSLMWAIWENKFCTDFLIPGFIFITVFLIFRIYSAWKTYSANPGLFNNVWAEVTTEHILSKTASIETKFDWGSVLDVSQNKSLLMFKITKSPAAYVAIPKRAFESPEEASEFFEYALNCWKTAKKEH